MRSLSGHLTKIGEENNVAVEVPVPVKKAKKVPVPVAVVAPPTVVIPDEAVEGKTLTLSPALSELLNVKALSRGQALKGLWAFIK